MQSRMFLKQERPSFLKRGKVQEGKRKLSEKAKFVFPTPRWIVIFVPGDTAFDFAPEHFHLRVLDSSSFPSFLDYHLSYTPTPHKSHKMDPQTQVDLSKLNEADKKELNVVLANEAQKSNIQQSKSPRRIADARIGRDAAAFICSLVY